MYLTNDICKKLAVFLENVLVFNFYIKIRQNKAKKYKNNFFKVVQVFTTTILRDIHKYFLYITLFVKYIL